MRDNIYYWKCDNGIPKEIKLRGYKDDYGKTDISQIVIDACTSFFGKPPVKVEKFSDSQTGNHDAYRVIYEDKVYFFRADESFTTDEYLLAEKAATDLARANGVKAPIVYFVDTTKNIFPIRYSIMEYVPGSPMNLFYGDKTMDREKAARSLAHELGKLHQIKLNKFGFINTDIYKETGKIEGLDLTNKDYFFKKLNDHLIFLENSGFLDSEMIEEIRNLIAKNSYALDIEQGYMVHKDAPFWNVNGTESEVLAILDWDDVISGDPLDDLAVIKCFYQDDVWLPFIDEYQKNFSLGENASLRFWLYFLRNMIWKAVFRIDMGYFNVSSNRSFINSSEQTLEEFTYSQIKLGIENLQRLSIQKNQVNKII